MNCFICAFKDVYIGLPGEKIERFIIPSADASGDEALSLPALFRTNLPAPHGAVIKPHRRILLVPRIESDTIIPAEQVYLLPKALAEKLPFLGITFLEEKPLLLLDIEKVFSMAEAQGD